MDVAVLGAETTGRTIAHLCARRGYEVNLHAADVTTVMDSIDIIERELDDAHTAGAIDDERRAATLDRLEGTTGLDAAVGDVDVVIETVTTDANELQKRFADIEERVDRETLVTTSQSAVSVTAAAAGLRHPDRALGLHFHRPLERPLVEVLVAEQTATEWIERAESFADGMDATTVRVRDTPGGGATRLALALEVEAMQMVADGIAGVEAVDTVLEVGYDHPMGPLERADRAGLHDRLDTLETLADWLGPEFSPPPLLAELVADGNTGMDAGEGFYVWDDDEPTRSALPEPVLARDRQPDDPGR